MHARALNIYDEQSRGRVKNFQRFLKLHCILYYYYSSSGIKIYLIV